MRFTTGLSELVLLVRDVRAAAKFYEDVVRLIPVRPADEEWAWFWAGEPGVNQRIGLHRGSLLFEEHSPHPPGKRFGCVHYAFEVPRDRIDVALAHLRASNIQVLGPVDFPWMNARSWYFYDPDGNELEFWSPNPAEPPSTKQGRFPTRGAPNATLQ